MSDPYVYPGTDVLRNKEDIRDADELEQFERLMSVQRQRQGMQPPPLTADGYRSIHAHLFQDVYEWAGQDRTGDIAKASSYFCRAHYVAPELDKRFAALKAENFLHGLAPEEFAARAAEHLSEINVIHPFREGNGRTQRLFLEMLGEQAGHTIDLTKIEPAAWYDASVSGFMKADYEPMRQVIVGAMQDGGNSAGRQASDTGVGQGAARAAELERLRQRREQQEERRRQNSQDGGNSR